MEISENKNLELGFEAKVTEKRAVKMYLMNKN
jgi:hypothetical protein